MTASRVAGLETAAFAALLGFVAALQISIAASGILLTFTAGLWIALLAAERGRPAAPPFFLALLAYAAATLVSAAFSLDPVASFVDSREVLLFVVAPIVFRLARGERAQTLATVIVPWAPSPPCGGWCSTAFSSTTISGSGRTAPWATT